MADYLVANPPPAGDDGREVEFGLSATHVQWHYVGDVAWTDLIALSSLIGATGATPELQATTTHLQWREPGGVWADLVALADLRGPQGDPAPLPVITATATTGAPGTAAAASVSGTYPALSLDLTIPEGEQGNPGPANSLAIGTVTTGAPGSSASASITGEPPEQVLNLTIPKGDAGGFVNATLWGTGRTLNEMMVAGTYVVSPSVSNTVTLGYPREGWGGYVEVIVYGAANNWVLQRATTTSAGVKNVYLRTGSGSSMGEWKRIVTEGEPGGSDLTGTGMPNGVVTASPGTYYTDTAGTNGAWRWLKKSGTGNTGWECVVGDTGWRNISSIAVNSWIGIMRLRRIGSTCSLHLDFVRLGTAVEVLTLPEGFRPPGNIKTTVLGGGAAQSIYLSSSGVLTKANIAHTGPTGGAEIWSWPLIDPWPTALPGTPA